MRFIATLLLALSIPVFAQTSASRPNSTLNRSIPAYYGAGFQMQPGIDLKNALYTILSARHGSAAGRPDSIGTCSGAGMRCSQHTAVGYNEARKILFGELFIERDGSGTFVTEVYCDQKVYFRQVSDIGRMDKEVNIEHTWPQSKFSSAFNKDLQKSDLHHLFPSDSHTNGVRGNYEFGEPKQGFDQDVPGCPQSQITDTSAGRVFTPPTEHRGNVARALFYFAVRYKLPISKTQEQVIRRWHKEDPIDQAEKDRHEKIAARQYNRNPFIDFPELADKISDF